MRLLIDLQGAQGGNRNRGIGRLTRALARAMVAAPGVHEPVILINEAMPDTADALSDEFTALLPRANIRFWCGSVDAGAIGGPECLVRRNVSEYIRAHAISAAEVDAVHVSSVFEGGADDAITNWPVDLHRPPHIATFYDAIPLINSEEYLNGAWRHLARWYLRQVQEVRRYDGLLAISESSRNEALRHLGADPNSVFNVRAGFDASTFRPTRLEPQARQSFLARNGLKEDYLLFVGAGDPRKNELGLLRSYAMLPQELRARHQLVIVGAGDPPGLVKEAAALGLRPQDLLLPRHISEQDLPVLYTYCYLFVMPSKHEGFGLPALEAMACGAPVIASNTTSLPEVVGSREALFDPHDPGSIAERILAALQDEPYRLRLVDHGLKQAAGFTWEESARRAWAALEGMEERGAWRARQDRGTVPARKPRLALIGGLPPASPDVHRADLDLVSDLGRHYAVELFTRSPFPEHDELGTYPCHREHELIALGTRYDRILYRLNGSDTSIRETLSIFPGVVVRRDEDPGTSEPDTEGSHDRDAVARAAFVDGAWHAVAALNSNRYTGEYTAPSSDFDDALSVIEGGPSTDHASPSLAAISRAALDDAYATGTAAQRLACIKALAGHDSSAVAQAVVRTFPRSRSARTLIHETCIGDVISSRGLMLREEAKSRLTQPSDKARVELVYSNGETLRLGRSRAAALLELPSYGLPDEDVEAGPFDTLLIRADVEAEGVSNAMLRRLRRCGTRVIMIVLNDFDAASPILSLADAMISSTEALGREMMNLIESGEVRRRLPIEIGWPNRPGALLDRLDGSEWPLRWRPPVLL